jgi:tRNA threonylcarbamoyladenosine modification (KEOPS) complex  Pcc1 subunit
MFKATIEIDDTDLFKVLAAEDDLEKDRSIAKIDGKKITITAKDVIAFKATVNGIIKIIEAYEKTSSAIK